MTSTEDWWITEYSNDIHNHLCKKELKRPPFYARSPHFQLRRYMVDWLAVVSEKLHFSATVQHLAVYILDYFMDNHVIKREQLQLVGLGSLIVAAKLEEKDSLIPKLSELNHLIGDVYKLEEFLHIELSILDFFKWEMLMPTAAHFVEYYNEYAVIATDFHAGKPLPCLKQAKVYVEQYIHYFLDISLQDRVFLKFLPSVIAASCVASTRICLFLSPSWPLSLQRVTRYKLEHLTSCTELMLKQKPEKTWSPRTQQSSDEITSYLKVTKIILEGWKPRILEADEKAAKKVSQKQLDEAGSDGSPSHMSDSSCSLNSPGSNDK